MSGTIAPPEGFDYYPADPTTPGIGLLSTWVAFNALVSFVTGRFGGKAVELSHDNNGFSTLMRAWPPSAQIATGFAYKLPVHSALDDGDGLAIFQVTGAVSGADVLLTLSLNRMGQLSLWAGAVGSTLLGRCTRLLYANTWQFIEISSSMSDGVGHSSVKIDGDLQFTFAGDNKPGATTQYGRTILVNPATSNQSTFDDLYWKYNDATTLGEARVQLFEVDGDFDVQFSHLSGASNFAMINDSSTDGDTSYNYSNTVNAYDLFNLADMTNNPDTIHSVCLVTAARKEDSGTRTIRNVVKLGPTLADGVDFNMTTDYLWVRDNMELDPNGDAWLKANFNLIKPGYKVIL